MKIETGMHIRNTNMDEIREIREMSDAPILLMMVVCLCIVIFLGDIHTGKK